jgi:hypothetical protein
VTGANVVLMAIVVAVLGFAVFRLAVPSKRKDRPGPHNNWCKNTSTSKSSGWSENFPGNGTDSLSGGAD